jgi:hypothetical protein
MGNNGMNNPLPSGSVDHRSATLLTRWHNAHGLISETVFPHTLDTALGQ